MFNANKTLRTARATAARVYGALLLRERIFYLNTSPSREEFHSISEERRVWQCQIHSHSRFNNLQEFIEEVMRSFSSHAPSDTLRVIKQHPLARGGARYSPLIEGLAQELGIPERVLYIHDPHLPTLLDHARGVVVINSTVGLSAIHHGVPLKKLVEAVYDMPDLTYQDKLGDFWQQPRKPLGKLYESFYNHVVQTTQINGNFYRRLPTHHYKSGVHWG